MPRDPRTYITVHDGMPEHPKVVGLSDAAFRLLIEAWCYCSRYLTDGKITEPAKKKLGSKRAWDELAGVGLIHIHPDWTISMHDYTEHQRTADEVADLRQKRAEAGAKGGKAKANGLALAKQVPDDLLDLNRSSKRSKTGSKSVAESETDTDTYG